MLPLEYVAGESAATLGLDGTETFDVSGIAGGIEPGQRVRVTAPRRGATPRSMPSASTAPEVDYERHGGILQLVLRQMLDKLVSEPRLVTIRRS